MPVHTCMDCPFHYAKASQENSKIRGPAFLYLGGEPDAGDTDDDTVNRTQHSPCRVSDRYSGRVFGVLRLAVLDRQDDRETVWGIRDGGAGSRTEEHCLCHMDGLYFHDSGHIHCWRFLQYMAQCLQQLAALSQKAWKAELNNVYLSGFIWYL